MPIPTVRLMMGDCLRQMSKIAKGSIDAIVTDPPYGMKWNTDCSRFSGGDNHHRKAAAGRDWEKSINGDDKPFDPEPYLGFPKVILWGSNHFAARLPVGTTLVWLKRNEAAFGTFLSDAEIGWMKGGHGVYVYKDLSMNGLARKRIHPSQKPVGLMKWCIGRLRLNPGSTILDPYIGSGTTGIAAIELGFNFIGIENDAEHFFTARDRIMTRHAEIIAATSKPLSPMQVADDSDQFDF